jgi:DNA-binding MarR family transcriptional regulator
VRASGDEDGGPVRTEAGLPYLLSRAEHAVAQRANQALAALGLTVRQMGALKVIAAAPGVSSVELAREVLVTRQTMGAMVTELVARGAVARTSGTGRVMHLEITTVGEDLLARAAATLRPVEEELFGALSPADARTLRECLWTVLGRAGDPAATGSPTRSAHRAPADPSTA